MTEDEIIGCSDAEIEEIRASQNAPFLPEEYVNFLRLGGKIHHELQDKYNLILFYPEALQNLTLTRKRVSNPDWVVPENIFVVAVSFNPTDSNDSFFIFYFVLEHGVDNPPVFFVKITESGFIHIPKQNRGFRAFTDILLEWIEIMEIIREETAENVVS